MYKKERDDAVGRHEQFSLVRTRAGAGKDVLPDLWGMEPAG
jgi:hypothetical protein